MHERASYPDWPRLMSEDLAAQYLSLGRSTLRKDGPAPVRHGRRRLYDRTTLDRWADHLGLQPMDEAARKAEAAEVERRFFERRNGQD